jgi:hypothetical protein
MKILLFTAAGIFAFIQSYCQQTTDSTGFKSRKLKWDEINLVSSYYNQNGNNASVTGGTGSEKLTDIANVFDIKMIRYDKRQRKHTLDLELGIDHYTSASSDKIDLQANSSASHADTRFYPSATLTVENETKGTGIGAGLSYSGEYDYQSFGFNLAFSKKNKDKSAEFGAKLQAYLDQVTLILPVELRLATEEHSTRPRNSYSGSFFFSRIVNQRFQWMLLADIVYQDGYLGLPFHRVYRQDGSLAIEKLPSSRLKIPVGIRANYFAGDKRILRSYYRFYTDDWGLNAHTANLELVYKVNPFFSISPFYRFYTQSAADYFAPYGKHLIQDDFYTSNYDLSKFNSHFMGAGFRIAPVRGVFGIQHFNMLEIRYGHYLRNTGLHSDIISMNIKWK